jgi:nucleoside-diphosphate-sugar epimerase
MCGDGVNTESTTYIDNLVEAILAALESPAAPGRAYLITDPFRIGWKDFLSRQLEASGVRPRFRRVPGAVAIPAAWMLDHAAAALCLPVPLASFGVRSAMTSRRFTSTRAHDELGYRPRIGLDDGMARLKEWVARIGGPDALVRADRTRPPV